MNNNPQNPHADSSALQLVITYAVFAGLWILFSDSIIALLFKNPSQLHLVSTIKGWLFVGVTSLLLYGLIDRLLEKATASSQRENGLLQAQLYTQRLLSEIAENSSDAIYAKDTGGRYLFVNCETLRITGKSSEELLGYHDLELFPQAQAEIFIANDQSVLKDNQIKTFEEMVSTPHGDVTFLATKGPLMDAEGHVYGLFGISRNITERKAIEVALRNSALHSQRLSDFNALLSEANEAIARAEDEKTLLQDLCELAIRRANLRLAWIAAPDAGGWFQSLAAAGAVGYLDSIRISTSEELPEGRGSAGQCWRGQRSVFNVSFLKAPYRTPWAERTQTYGFASSASLPIFRRGERWAILGTYLGEENILDAEIQKILTDLAQDIGYGLDRLDSVRREQEANAFNMALLDSLTAGINVTRYPDRVVERANKRMLDIFGAFSLSELVGRQGREFYPDDETYAWVGIFAEDVVRTGYGTLRDVPYRRLDGRIVFIDLSGQRLSETDGVTRVVWTHVDVTERRATEHTIRELSSSRAALLANTAAGILLMRYPDQVFVEVNQGFLKITGYQNPEEIVGRTTSEIYPDSSQNHRMSALAQEVLKNGQGNLRDLKLRRKDGLIIYLDVSGQLLGGGDPDQPIIVWTSIDVTERHRLTKELSRQALLDKLTGLPNRRALDLEFQKAMARVRRYKRMLAVVMMDLDGFKPINDTYGHDSGDRVLQVIGKRLQETLRHTDFVARLGGDEFVLLIEDCKTFDEINKVLDKVGQALCAPITLDNAVDVRVAFSAGISLYPQIDTDNPDALMRYADQALYENKAHKTDRLHFWTVYGERTPQRENEAQALLRNGGLRVFYQPIMENRGRRIIGIEALARLQDGDGRMLCPAEFLPLLTRDDLFQLSRRMLEQALLDLESLDQEQITLWVSINIDPRNVSDACIVYLQNRLTHAKITPQRIYLEILEGSNFEEQQLALDHLFTLKAHGVRLALDDVGSAYSSLLRLRDLPIDKVKLDQKFVQALEERPEDIQFVESVLDLANGLGLDLVVEGVETEDILDAMTALGVPSMQGYAIARPMPFSVLREFLRRPPRQYYKHPISMLGLYAKQLSSHSALKKAILQNPHLIDRRLLLDASTCPIHEDLNQLLVPSDSLIHRLHAEYHRTIAVTNDRFIVDPGNRDWSELKTVQGALQAAIIAEYHRRKSAHEVTVNDPTQAGIHLPEHSVSGRDNLHDKSRSTVDG